jgi:hypothetical protein
MESYQTQNASRWRRECDMGQQQVLVKWLLRGVAEGKLRLPGDEDVLLQKKAKFLQASGIIDIVGSAERTVPLLSFDEEEDA